MDCNIQNRTIFCRDNLEILQGINSSCIDLIYLDPPFNKNKVFSAPTGSSAEGASFSDIFREEDVKDEWLQTIQEDYEQIYTLLSAVNVLEGRTSYNFCYLSYMAIRLIEMHRILRDTGSIYLHCDPTMSHYLKILMDCIFGEKNFINEIVWNYKGTSNSKKMFGKKHDYVLLYVKTPNYIFNTDNVRIPYTNTQSYKRDQEGRVYKKWSEKVGVYYPRQEKVNGEWQLLGKTCLDVFDDIPSMATSHGKEYVGYPTQKPIALLERIIQASSNERDIVLDPFCGCATTCVAAEKWARQWIGIDVSHKTYELVQKRLKTEVEEKRNPFDPDKDVRYSTSPPKRTDIGADYREQKYVYILSNPKDPGWYKVGIAKHLSSRLSSQPTSVRGRILNIEFYYETPLFREIEKHIQDTFDNDHEWVRAELSTLREAIENYKQKA